MRPYILLAPAALLLTACVATAPTHNNQIATPLAAVTTGDIDSAISGLDSQMASPKAKEDLLLNLEKGELLRLGSRYTESLEAFEVADSKIKQWEETAKSAPEKLLGQVGALFGGDSSLTYEGQDYEKVMLTTRMAMNRIALGDIDTARVDIKRTHEREAIIAEFRARETSDAAKEAEAKGMKAEFKELDGYPIETLNDPDVLALKNGYQNALSHYLAGFLYEVLGEPGLAAPGYRQAIELRPNSPALEQGLAGLDARTGFRAKRNMTDVLFIVEAGNAPARESQKIAFPVPTGTGLVTVSFAFPVIRPEAQPMNVNEITIGSQKVSAALVTDFNAMARKALQTELPGIQTRAAVRAIGKGLIQDQVNRQLGMFGGLMGNLIAAATEGDADDRMWRGLPNRVFIARSFVAPGEYEVNLPGYTGATKQMKIDGRYMVVPVRLYESKTYFGEPVQLGKLAAIPAPEKVGTSAPKKTKTEVKATTKKPPAKAKPAAPAIKATSTKPAPKPTQKIGS